MIQSNAQYDDTITFAQAYEFEDEPIVQNEPPQRPVREQQAFAYDGYGRFFRRQRDRSIRLAFIILELAIGFRIFLKAIAANPDSGFASLIYTLTGPFLAPFSGLVPAPSVNGSILEFSSMIAMLVYLVFFWLVAYALHMRRES